MNSGASNMERVIIAAMRRRNTPSRHTTAEVAFLEQFIVMKVEMAQYAAVISREPSRAAAVRGAGRSRPPMRGTPTTIQASR